MLMKSVRYLFIITLFLTSSELLLAQQTPKVELPEELQRVLTDYETHWKNNDTKALSMLFTEEGFILRPRFTLEKGRANIEESYKNSGGDLKLHAFDYHIEGRLAYILGGYTYGNQIKDMGKYTLILKKVEGKWLIHSDMDNGNN